MRAYQNAGKSCKLEVFRKSKFFQSFSKSSYLLVENLEKAVANVFDDLAYGPAHYKQFLNNKNFC